MRSEFSRMEWPEQNGPGETAGAVIHLDPMLWAGSISPREL
jgi:hypothetical protein